jgi:hypothetical protein
MNRRLTALGLIAGLALTAAALAAGASADTVKIGSTLGHAENMGGELCSVCTGVQRSQVGGNTPLPLTSPANGVVTSWAVRTSDVGAVYNLRILSPAGAAAYAGAGTSPAITVPLGTTDSVLVSAVSMPIEQGDAIGASAGPSGHDLPSWPDNVNADVLGYAPVFVDGGPAATTTNIPGHELLIQATVKFCNVPNVVGQTQAAATAAIAAADCTSTATTLKLPLRVIKKTFSKKKKKKKTKAANKKLRAQNGLVLSQGSAPGTTAAPPGPAVALIVGEVVKPPKKKKKKH